MLVQANVFMQMSAMLFLHIVIAKWNIAGGEICITYATQLTCMQKNFGGGIQYT